MYVCTSVRNGFTIEIHGFMHSLRVFWHVPLRMPSRDAIERCHAMEIEVEDSEQRPNESRCSFVPRPPAFFVLQFSFSIIHESGRG